ncbi:MAG: hypothetical protein EBT06_14420 [Gammaproteobacteria bacterium]|nr:hypothetical protein [Gammaproteobacteria bacterium]
MLINSPVNYEVDEGALRCLRVLEATSRRAIKPDECYGYTGGVMSGKCPKNVSVDSAMGNPTKGSWPMAFGGQKPSFGITKTAKGAPF